MERNFLKTRNELQNIFSSNICFGTLLGINSEKRNSSYIKKEKERIHFCQKIKKQADILIWKKIKIFRSIQMEKTRRKKIKFQKVFIVFLLVFIIFAFFNNLYRSQFQGKYKILDQTILFEKSIPCSGFLIFDEEIFNLPEETVNNLEEVSGRNNKGYKVGTILIGDINKQLTMQKKFWQEEKEFIFNKLIESSIQNLQTENLIDEFQRLNFNSNRFLPYREFVMENAQLKEQYTKDNLEYYESEITEKIKKIDNWAEDNVKILETYQSGGEYQVIMDTAGILIPYLDGYEGIFNTKNMLNYSYDDLKTFYFDTSLNQFRQGYKIVNNLKYYMNLTVDDVKLFSENEIGKKITVEIEDLEVIGKIELIKKTKNGTFLNISFQEDFDSLGKQRWINGKIILEKKEAFSLPESVLIHKDNQTGVMISNDASIAEFVPVEVLGKKDSKIILFAGKRGIITIKGKDVPSLSLYQRVLLNPERVAEGEFLD